MPTAEEIRQLKQLVLESVAAGRPLPGMGRRVELPDIGLALAQPEILLEETTTAGSFTGDSLPQSLRTVSLATIKDRARHSDVAFLRLSHEILDENAVRITVEVRLQPAAPHSAPFPLSATHIAFRKRAGRWEVEGEPTMVAT